ncbi:MAG: amidophosphoribosyltransferase [Phycisphaerae bacterium]|nr:amidophosphoribosyltransferase [Phycisphaerae bacterium]
MSNELQHECGIAALYWLDAPVGRNGAASKLIRNGDVTPLMPTMLLNLQNRGQLAAGISRYQPGHQQILDTFKDIGSVAEAFRMSHPAKHQAILEQYAGRAAIGHTRYATCGQDDVRYAQPFERHHGRLWKWYAFGFNGNLANYTQLRDRILSRRHYVFTLDTDTEILMHELSYRLRGDKTPDLLKVWSGMSRTFDGAYNIAFLDAMGRMVVARDPLGLRPLSYAVQGRLFAAASESVALTNLGFDHVRDLPPGHMAVIENGKFRVEAYSRPRRKAHCFFEWVYFSNVASEQDGCGVYAARNASGLRLADVEDQPIDEDCIVVPVPDTAKAAADAFAYRMHIPCVEGLMRNRYVGRTFIQGDATRGSSARNKYTPLPKVLEGKRVFLLEDSIVRSTTLRVLAEQIRRRGRAKEVHVRVACPPIIAPCFYGIDMSTLGELFAPRFVKGRSNGVPDDATLKKMARELGVDSLRYLPVADLGPCIGIPNRNLCLGCVTGKYPSARGNRLFTQARKNLAGRKTGRTYE